MDYSLEQLKQYEQLINTTLQTGTIKGTDKKLLEEFLFKVTGSKVNCMGCNLHNILNILKAYKKKFDEQTTNVVVQSSTPVVDPLANTAQQDTKPKNKGGRPPKDKTAQI